MYISTLIKRPPTSEVPPLPFSSADGGQSSVGGGQTLADREKNRVDRVFSSFSGAFSSVGA